MEDCLFPLYIATALLLLHTTGNATDQEKQKEGQYAWRVRGLVCRSSKSNTLTTNMPLHRRVHICPPAPMKGEDSVSLAPELSRLFTHARDDSRPQNKSYREQTKTKIDFLTSDSHEREFQRAESLKEIVAFGTDALCSFSFILGALETRGAEWKKNAKKEEKERCCNAPRRVGEQRKRVLKQTLSLSFSRR